MICESWITNKESGQQARSFQLKIRYPQLFFLAAFGVCILQNVKEKRLINLIGIPLDKSEKRDFHLNSFHSIQTFCNLFLSSLFFPFHLTSFSQLSYKMSAFRLVSRPLQNSRRHLSTSLPSRLAAVTQKTTPEALSAAALHASGPMRNDWTRDEIQSVYDSPLMDLLYHGVSFYFFV